MKCHQGNEDHSLFCYLVGSWDKDEEDLHRIKFIKWGSLLPISLFNLKIYKLSHLYAIYILSFSFSFPSNERHTNMNFSHN